MMKFFLFFVIVLCYACAQSADADLENTLNSAGKNRPELEYVLDYYSRHDEDSLKYKSAKYLLENMTYHYSYKPNKKIDSMLHQIEAVMDSVSGLSNSLRDSIYREMLAKYEKLPFERVYDTKVITSKFLINNIENSFKIWQNSDWARHLSFDEFCEFILPYKIYDGQILDNWKEYFFKKYNDKLANLKYASLPSRSSYTACNILNEALRQDMNPQLNSSQNFTIISMKVLSKITSGPCDSYTYLANAVMRANGIPSGMDFTPQWPFRSLGHSWNFLVNNTKKEIVFEAAGDKVGTPHKLDHIMVKVFRKTYKINKDIEELIKKQKNRVPILFSTPYIQDVTDKYMETADIKVNVNTDDPYVYLAVFDNAEWKILDFAKNKNGIAYFKNIGKDALFLPVRQAELGVEEIGPPFIHHPNGTIELIQADTTKKQELKLFRKYPMLENVYVSNLRKLGMKIQGANKSDFSDAVTFHVFDNFDTDVKINKQRQNFQYWRLLSAENGHSNIAELYFYKNGDKKPYVGKVIGTQGSWVPEKKYEKGAAFDHDLLTFFDAPEGSGGWVGMSYEKPVEINRVVCFMRGDGNDIELGDEYELMYWNSGKWRSLGLKIADDISVNFSECPQSALFLLHNKTRGTEERIFTYQNNRQVWW
ncbi:hypothetical protein QE382_003213 [Sphingobacterium zeae]|uniref:Peptide-N(4)-(N-acetyl-beta-glucosaminyl)asparagine amidase n=1 Tax=Sphingobacterium zeae TaxID=1776859 RepID=A0ABU0U8E3_9SPHI|nr:hypothetical protein [Sphingobacterium zeae]MDQ1151229.1 hypothetical protein [Sphingobacterium zeae]